VRGVINDFRTFHSNLYKVGHVFFTEGASLFFILSVLLAFVISLQCVFYLKTVFVIFLLSLETC